MNISSRWPIVSLAEVSEINPTRPRALSELPDDHVVSFVPMPAVDQYLGTIANAEARKFSEVRKGFTYFAENDVIFAKITPCMQNGKSAVARGLYNKLGFGSTEFHVIRAIESKIIPEWIWYFVRRHEFRAEGTYHFRGAVGQQRVPAEYLASALIPLPPVDEQRRIVNRINECLSRVEEIEKLRADGLREADILQSAVFADFVESVRLTGVETVSLGDVVTECKYGTSVKASATGNGCPVLRMGNIKRGQLDISDLKHIELPTNERAKYLLSQGDILVNRTNSLELVGKSAMFDTLPGEWIYASYLVRLRVNRSRALPEYVNGVINSRIGRDYVLRTARRAIGMVNINAKEIQKMPLPLPPIDVQRDLVGRMGSTAPLVEGLAAEMNDEAITSLRSSILRRAFAGEL